MGNSKFEALMWEKIIIDNFASYGAKFSHINLDGVFWDEVDEFIVGRDDDYNLNILCKRHIDRLNPKYNSRKDENDVRAGEVVPEGKLTIDILGDWQIEMSPCYNNGYESKLDETIYNIQCFHIEGKCISKKAKRISEWIINGAPRGLMFCTNDVFEYKVEESVSGTYGEMTFPVKRESEAHRCCGRITHIKFRDTAFDVHYVGNAYGPQWCTNLSITYDEKYGRIPCDEERKIIRDYLSFFIGKRLIYVGESSYDEYGDVIGFVMESPRTFGMDIKSVCANGAMPPISSEYADLEVYFNSIEKYIDTFADQYAKLDFEDFFLSYWYANEMAKPLDLPILASALEHLMKKWYKEVAANPDTVLMDKSDFGARVKPIKELVLKQFEDSDYAERMVHSVDNMNRMSVNEQIAQFFSGIDLAIGFDEREAMRARNFSVHGSYKNGGNDYYKQMRTSRIYECLLSRVILKLLDYEGQYVDYGTIGYPQKDIIFPCGKIEKGE